MDDISIGTLFGVLFLLILFSAFFSGSETALMTLNRYRLRHLSDQGHPAAKRAEDLLKKPDRLIGLILLGNNAVNILASAIATIIALRLGDEGAIAIATGLLTLVVLIFSEITPKTLAALHPERLAFPAAIVYTPAIKIMSPLLLLLNAIPNKLLRIMGVYPDDADPNALSHEEFRTVVNEAGAMIPRKHHKMLLSILDLARTTVDDIMIPRNEVDGVDLEQPLDDQLNELRESPYSRVLLFRNSIDNVVGFIHVRRLMQAGIDNEITQESLERLVRKPYFIPKGTPLNTQLLNFQREKRRIGLVVDEYGDVLGLVTMSDLLEEIVGEFTSDPADSIADVHPQEDGSFLVDGSANLRELVRTYHWKLPTDGPRTLNGLLMERLESIPETGTSILIEGYPIEILQTQGNAVKIARIQPRLAVDGTENRA